VKFEFAGDPQQFVDPGEVADDDVIAEFDLHKPPLSFRNPVKKAFRRQPQEVADDADPEEHAGVGDQEAADIGLRAQIAVADRGHGHQGPPDAVAEGQLRLGRMFGPVEEQAEKQVQSDRQGEDLEQPEPQVAVQAEYFQQAQQDRHVNSSGAGAGRCPGR